MKTKIILQCLFALLQMNILALFGQNNTIISQNWSSNTPSLSEFRRVALTTDGSGNTYVAGHYLNAYSTHDIIVQKYLSNGNLAWERTYDGPGGADDFAGAITLDANRNVYITGAATVSATVGFSIVVLKYDSLGTLGWSYIYNNGSNYSPLAGGTALTFHSNNLYVVGSTFGSSTLADYVTIKLNAATGSQTWATRYDKAGYRDIPNAIIVTGSTVRAFGATEIYPNAYRYTLAVHNLTTGALSSSLSVGDTITDINEVSDVVVKGNHTFIVGGKYSTTTGYDWIVVEFDQNGQEVNRITETSTGNANDMAKGITFDPSGNIYVAGYLSATGEGKNMAVAKYNSSGVRQWIRQYGGANASDDVALRVVRDASNRISVAGYVDHTGQKDYIILGYNASDGKSLYQVEYDSPYGLDDEPTDLFTDGGNFLTIVGNSKKPDGKYEPRFINYELRERIIDIARDTANTPLFVKNEIIVRFREDIMDTLFIDSEKRFAKLSKLIPSNAMAAMVAKTGFKFDDAAVWAEKIFIGLKTTDTVSTSRGGQKVYMDPVWSSFVIHINANDTVLSAVTDSLNLLPDFIRYAHKNYVGEPFHVPNDTYYSQQLSYKNNVDDPGGIGIEAAWDIQQGKDKVSVGIFDSEMYWAHPDFGDGTFQGSVVRGWDFCSHQDIQNIPYPEYFHGTNTGGIIGAIKNNSIGVAGIAGKNPAVPNSGAKIFSYKIFRDDVHLAITSDIASSIYRGSSFTPNYGLGMHVQNHSWGIYMGGSIYNNNVNHAITVNQNHIALLKDAVRTAWTNECVFIAARGNKNDQVLAYPSCYPDAWVINVGASGVDGERKIGGNLTYNGTPTNYYSSFGGNMDLIAPGSANRVYTSTSDAYYQDICSNNVSGYNCSAGSSISAPHVSGSAALILSEQNTVYPHHTGNLVGEDIEYMMQFTAQDKGITPGYEIWSGWGLLRMDSLMPMIDAPKYRVIHRSGLAPIQKIVSLQQANDTVFMMENSFGGIPYGEYIADRYQVTAIFQDDLGTATYIAGWGLNCRGQGQVSNGIIYNDVNFNYSSIGVGSFVTSSTDYSCYFVKHKLGNSTPINKWIVDTIKVITPYSLWVYDEDYYGTSIQENDISELNVFPVPSSDIVNVSIEGVKGNDVRLEMISVDGKIVYAMPLILSDGKGVKQIEVGGFSPGIYFLRANFGTYIKTKKIVIQ